VGGQGRRCEGIRLASLPVRQPNAAAQENGTGATRQSRWLRTADGFAVLSSTATKTPLEDDHAAHMLSSSDRAFGLHSGSTTPDIAAPKHRMGEGKSRQFLAWLAALLFERHKKIGPPFSGPKLLKVLLRAPPPGDDDGAVREKH